jgi:hypothetical protein
VRTIPGQPRAGGGGALQALLRPLPAELMAAHLIGAQFGNVRNDDAALIERVISA